MRDDEPFIDMLTRMADDAKQMQNQPHFTSVGSSTPPSARKPSNPKDILGSKRIPMDLIHPLTLSEGALAMVEGMLKYGKWNFLAVGVRVSIYIGAAMRHLLKYYFGEERDPKTGVHHLGSVIACVNIIFAAKSANKLTDDRPPSSPNVPSLVDEFEARVAHLQELFKDFHPKHYSIQDEIDG